MYRYRCDIQMALKKGIRQICNKRCKSCLCAIRTDEWGREGHVPDLRGGSPNFMLRNTITMSGYDREGKRGRPISYRGDKL